MRFCGKERLRGAFAGKRVAIVGSGPGVLDNEPGFIDGHDVVVRVNNYKTSAAAGHRTDVHYSFFGRSIRKTAADLRADGVSLVMCKCPNAKFMDSEWHRRNNKPHGVDFRYIYEHRESWWFCDTYVPELSEFMASFWLLDHHVPTTGFAALLAVREHQPASIYLTGFDFFASRVHNVNEPWRAGDPSDPICHRPDLERAWLANNLAGIQMDRRLTDIMRSADAVLDQ